MLVEDHERQQRLGVAELRLGQVPRVQRQREQREERGEQARGLVGQPGGREALELALHARGTVPAWAGGRGATGRVRARGSGILDGRPPIGVLLLPRELERFILREQAEDLLRAPHVVAVDPPRVPYGAIARLPETLGDALAVAPGAAPRADACAATSASRGRSSSSTRCSAARAAMIGSAPAASCGTGAGTATSTPTTRPSASASGSPCCTSGRRGAPR